MFTALCSYPLQRPPLGWDTWHRFSDPAGKLAACLAAACVARPARWTFHDRLCVTYAAVAAGHCDSSDSHGSGWNGRERRAPARRVCSDMTPGLLCMRIRLALSLLPLHCKHDAYLTTGDRMHVARSSCTIVVHSRCL